jgi:NADPH:quinone reductase-like Zn-dependent oxidoreductase
MRAVLLADLPEREISGECDVLVRVRAAGINPVDYKLWSYATITGVRLAGAP